MSLKKLIISTLSVYLTLSACVANAAAQDSTNSPSTAADTNSSDILSEKIILSNAWARPSNSKNNNSAVYLDIQNVSDVQYNLVNWNTDIANVTELHDSFIDEKGVSKMVKLDKLIIPAKTFAVLKPGSTHIMLLNLKRPLIIGDKFNLVLYFDNNVHKVIEVEVK